MCIRDSTSFGLSYNKEIILSYTELPTISIQTSVEAVTELMTVPNNSYNVSIELNSDGSLSAACENKISKIAKDIRIMKGGDMIQKSIANIAASVKSGDIAFTGKVISPNQVELAIEVMSENLLPTLDDVDEHITVIVKYLITFRDFTIKVPEIPEDVVEIGVAVAGVVAICAFVPVLITGILGFLVTLGLVVAADA